MIISNPCQGKRKATPPPTHSAFILLNIPSKLLNVISEKSAPLKAKGTEEITGRVKMEERAER